MTVTVKVTQTCNGCNTSRELTENHRPFDSNSIRQAAEMGGWREVRDSQHLCPACITKALEGSFNEQTNVSK